MSRVISLLRAAAALVVLTVGSIVMLLAAIPTLGLARRFYSAVIGRWIGAGVLGVAGIRYRVHGHSAAPSVQTVYVSNHTSTLDIFILIALALPRTRFFSQRIPQEGCSDRHHRNYPGRPARCGDSGSDRRAEVRR